MKIVGCDLHAGQQSIAMIDSETGELTEKVARLIGLRWRGTRVKYGFINN